MIKIKIEIICNKCHKKFKEVKKDVYDVFHLDYCDICNIKEKQGTMDLSEEFNQMTVDNYELLKKLGEKE